MGERVSLGAVGKRLGVSGGDIRRAGHGKVTAAQLHASKHQPTVWLRKAQARKRGSACQAAGRAGAQRIEVSCCSCGTVRRVRPTLVKCCMHLVCGPCGRVDRWPEVPSRPGMVLVQTFNVAGFFDGYTYRIATAGERASSARAAALVRAAVLNAPGEPGRDG